MAALFKSSPKAPSSSTSAVPPSPADAPRSRPEPQPQPQPQAPPQPQSQPQSQSQSQSQPQPESKKPQVGGESYYGYLFSEDKSPTDTLDALLRALGQYIIDHIGDTNDKQLNPRKLAAFYHAVGGDYDALFNSPDRTISYIWQALGVQHALQPVPDNDYAPPSVPALTLRGFVRWQSLQILLGPEEHVPYIQYAVANWNLKNPYTGNAFPVDLPATAFPAVCDPAVDEWHRACGQKLREAATPSGEEEQPSRRPDSDSRTHTTSGNKAHGAPTGTPPRQRVESEYFRRRQPMAYVHVSEPRYTQHTSHPTHPIIPEANNHRVSSSSGSSLEDLPRRGRRNSEMKPPPVIVREDTRGSAHLDPHRPPNVRRHSHTYQSPYAASIPDSDSDSETLRASPRHNTSIPQPHPTIRRIPVASPIPATAPSRLRRSEIRAEDPRRISLQAEIKQKFASFLSSSNRQRSTSREPGPIPHASVRYRKELPHARLSRSLSGESYTSDGSLTEITPKYASRDNRDHNRARERIIDRERERDREIERERERERDRAREWDEMDRKSRKEKAYLRPAINRRTSSHADIDRRRQDALWDARERRRESRDLEREVRRNLTSDELDRRERRRYQDPGLSPPISGVSGRRYPR